MHTSLPPPPPPPPPPPKPSKAQIKVACRQARELELAEKVEEEVFTFVEQGYEPVWIDTSAKLSEWTNQMIARFNIFPESRVSIALLLDPKLGQKHVA